LTAVDHLRRLDPRGFENRRHDIDDVVELVRMPPASLMRAGHEFLRWTETAPTVWRAENLHT
jgi:hypothetical protein